MEIANRHRRVPDLYRERTVGALDGGRSHRGPQRLCFLKALGRGFGYTLVRMCLQYRAGDAIDDGNFKQLAFPNDLPKPIMLSAMKPFLEPTPQQGFPVTLGNADGKHLALGYPVRKTAIFYLYWLAFFVH